MKPAVEAPAFQFASASAISTASEAPHLARSEMLHGPLVTSRPPCPGVCRNMFKQR